jgi:threonyl-tRNA synthetase
LSGQVKDHVDFAYELDLVIKPDSTVPLLGREFNYYVGSGVPLFSIGGGYFRHALQQILVGFHARRGYFIAETPIIASSELFKLSGHMEFYRSNMFIFDIEDKEYVIKPMNCPFHLLIFLSHIARYRGKVRLPFKVFEVGRVHRYEPSGSLYGLLRVRGFTQDDAHIIAPESEALNVVFNVFEEMVQLLEGVFNLKVSSENIYVRLSVSDRSLIGREFMGTIEEWEAAERALEEAVKAIEGRYGVSRVTGVGEAAFYGPKIDVMMVVKGEATVKEWQMGTIQFDFNLPRRFRIYDVVREVYGETGVFVIHRALLGSIERFLGGYLELSKGRLPVHLAPLQIAVIAIKTGEEPVDKDIEFKAVELKDKLVERGFRVGVKETTKTSIGGDVRHIESTVKPPILVFIGEKEVKEGVLSLSVYTKGGRVRKQVQARTVAEAVKEIEGVVLEEEKRVYEISGVNPRIPADLSHVL